MKRHRILIVEDSALMRQLLTEILGRDPELEIVGTANDPYQAWSKIQQLQPDAITLDVEMPRMDGLSFLEKLMRARPTPVVMVSTLTAAGSAITLRALELGAVDFVAKPKIDVRSSTVEMADLIVAKVKAAAGARLQQRRVAPPAAEPAGARPAGAGPAAAARTQGLRFTGTHRIIAVGSSTGGTEALKVFLGMMPADGPGVVVVQHMPEGFTRAYPQRLDSLGPMRAREAEDGDLIIPGRVLVAPGNAHLRIRRSGAAYSVHLSHEPPVGYHRPAIDVMFASCAAAVGANAIGVILTGMGADGARGMRQMHDAGAYTYAQDERTSVVFGMPKEAIALGGVDEVLPLDKITPALLARLR